MSLSKSKAALAVAGAMALGGVAGQAHASAYAGSYLLVDSFQISFDQAVGISRFDYTLTNTAVLNGSAAPTSTATCGGSFPLGGSLTTNCSPSNPGPVLDASPANAPGGTISRTNNSFSFFGNGSNTYSNSDSVIITDQLTGDPSTKTTQIAESEVQTTGNGNASAEIQSTTGIVMVVDLASGGTTMNMSFAATPILRAYLSDPLFLSGSVQANVNASFTLTDADGNEVNWNPNGSCDSAITGATCTVNQDGVNTVSGGTQVDLNRNLPRSQNVNQLFTYNPGTGLVSITIDGLDAGEYTLGLNLLTSSRVSLQQVPEPGSLALLGLALAGVGFTRYRAAKSA